MTGKTVLHYKMVEKLGQGGMGIVYLAEDNKLKRRVAIKFLPHHIAMDSEERKRFEIEAQAAAALNDANIATIHSIEESGDNLFLVMEYIEGQELRQKVKSGPLDPKVALKIAFQIARGLKAAHEKNIIHRDIKSANIMVSPNGDVKIMDFGLAKFRGSAQLTRAGTTVGTVAYMCPEQARGEEIDQKADIWSFGVVLYEMLTGQLPFQGDYEQAVTYAILNEEPRFDIYPENVPEKLKAIVQKTLRKIPEERYGDAGDLLQDLQDLMESSHRIDLPMSENTKGEKSASRIKLLISAGLIFLLLLIFGFNYFQHQKKLKWAREVVLPKIKQLADDRTWNGEGSETWDAFNLSNKVKEYLYGDPLFEDLQKSFCIYSRFNTDPQGAKVYIKSYMTPDSQWYYLGQTPIDSIRLPISYVRLKVEKTGYEDLEDIVWIWSSFKEYRYFLTATGELPDGMVRASGSKMLGDFLIDRYEVTNRQFKRFVDDGGYRNKKYWKQDIIKDGKIITWEDAVRSFVDKTGVTGPSTWEVGDYPKGEDDYPVAGVSWYEAAAYAEFAGKIIPSYEHWRYVAAPSLQPEIVPFSNLNGDRTRRVGTDNAENRFGTYDMAGNVREWCWNNIAHDEKKFILGGGWNDPDYSFSGDVVQSPLDRSVTNGFRCMKYLPTSNTADSLFRAEERERRDYSKEKPASDIKFREFKRMYFYAKLPLNPKVEAEEEISDEWIKEKVTIDAAYNDEKIPVYFFLPKNSAPPWQAIVYFPGAAATRSVSSKTLMDMRQIGFIPKSGRALIYPVYKGTYERYVKKHVSQYPVLRRDIEIKRVQDFQRVIDYLESREDIDHDKLSYYGFSMGGIFSPLVLGNENRLKTAVLNVAGLPGGELLPEIDPINFAPRVTIPVLMLNGKYDSVVPYETSQKPLFELFGTKPDFKKWLLYENGHTVPRQQLIKECLEWWNTYLGPVKEN